MSVRKELFRLGTAILAFQAIKLVNDCIQNSEQIKNIPEIESEKSTKIIAYTKKINDANKLINDESNRLITWSLSIIGGSILTIISTSYIRPTGLILYSYFLFALGWIFLGLSIYFGEIVTRIYIAGATTNDDDFEAINKIGYEAD